MKDEANSDTYGGVTILRPIGWQLEYDREWTGPGTHDYSDDLDSPKFKRQGLFANSTSYNAHEIEMRSHYNGSGPTAFGGAKRWPVIEALVSFQQNEYALAAEFASELAEFVHNWMKERNR